MPDTLASFNTRAYLRCLDVWCKGALSAYVMMTTHAAFASVVSYQWVFNMALMGLNTALIIKVFNVALMGLNTALRDF